MYDTTTPAFWPHAREKSTRTAWIPHQPGNPRPRPGDTVHIANSTARPGRIATVKRRLATTPHSTLVSHQLPHPKPPTRLFDQTPTPNTGPAPEQIAHLATLLHDTAQALTRTAQALTTAARDLAPHQPPDPPPRPTRTQLHAQTGGHCYICLRPITDPEQAHIDHIEPRALGGPDTPDNLALTHPTCNTTKAARRWDELPPQLTPLADLTTE